jgi:hypothetical protein
MGEAAEDPFQPGPRSISASTAPSDFPATLLEIINSVSNDPRQLRNLVYEFARGTLNTGSAQISSKLSRTELAQREFALEAAIACVEVDCVGGHRVDFRSSELPISPKYRENKAALVEGHHAGLQTGLSAGQRSNVRSSGIHPVAVNREQPASAVREVPHEGRAASGNLAPMLLPGQPIRRQEVISVRAEPVAALRSGLGAPSGPTNPLRAESTVSLHAATIAHTRRPQVEIVYREREDSAMARSRRRLWLWFIAWPFLLLAGPAIFSLLLYVALTGRLDLQSTQTQQAGEQRSQQLPWDEGASSLRRSGLPLPSSYGVYAISNGGLSELQPLPMRAPDARVSLSAEVTRPSRTILPSGKVAFVAFRRELLNSAPQNAAVRVVARVERETKIVGGKAVSTNLTGSWRVRNNSFEFKVSPVSESREMVAIRSEADDLALPAGRYVLVFGGLAYDFTVGGEITNKAQCLESFEVVSGPIFSDCRSQRDK